MLQKINIIRDFLEDIEEEPAPRYHPPPPFKHLCDFCFCCLGLLPVASAARHQTICIASHSPHAGPAMSLHVAHMVCLSRMFWPKEIWGLYGEALADFKEPSNASQAVQCLNHMVTDALRSDMTTLLDESAICTLPHLYFTVCTLHQRQARQEVVG